MNSMLIQKKLIEQLSRIADALDKQNLLEEKKIKLKKKLIENKKNRINLD